MITRNPIKLIDSAYHRNGICGAPFQVALFEEVTIAQQRYGTPVSRKVAILFDAPDHCAVLDVAKLAQGDIAFGSNSWRGDRFEQALRQAIATISTHQQ